MISLVEEKEGRRARYILQLGRRRKKRKKERENGEEEEEDRSSRSIPQLRRA